MRLSWDELDKDVQRVYIDMVDLEEGETMSDWWETYNDAVEEDGSWRTEGFPGYEWD